MALTADVKDELARAEVGSVDARKAELAALLRFASGFRLENGAMVLDVDVDGEAIATRVAGFLRDLFGAEPVILPPGGGRRSGRRTVRLVPGAADIARRLGLVDGRGRPVRGLPSQIVGGTVVDAEGAWRGAFLAHGSVTEPGRSSALEVTCPSAEAALALVGAARRLGIGARSREMRGAERVVLRDGEDIGALLTRMGAQASRMVWEEQRQRREVRATANRLANFDDANLRRSARAAVAAAARVERALEILGEEVPEHLQVAGELRITHRQASLEELGRLSEPPMSKDAVAGRIRRLLAMADRRAAELGIPDTESAVTADLLDEA